MGGIVLHGICYDFFFVAGFIYTDKKASKNIRGAAQGFLVLITQGLGLGIGAQIMGRIVNANITDTEHAWQTIWLIPAIFSAGVAMIFFLFFHDRISVSHSAAEQAALEANPTETLV